MRNEMTLTRVAVAAAALMVLPLTAQGQNYVYRSQIDTTVRLDKGGTVDLGLISGNIRVTGWDRQEVKVTASIEEGLLRFDANSSRVTLSVERSDEDRHRNRHNVGEARFDVSVPRGTKLLLEAVSGDVVATGSQGEVDANSVSGDVRVTDAVREANVQSVSGSVTANRINGDLRAESVSGDVRAEEISGKIEANTVSGGIRLIGAKSRDVRTETVSGDIIYTGTIEPSGRYDFESHSGTVRMNIPRSSGAQVSVETFSGDVSTDFTATMQPANRRRNGHFEFTIGDGRARITAQTFSGRIEINDDAGSSTRRDDE